jgi:hydrogenase expression/formation protein HypC
MACFPRLPAGTDSSPYECKTCSDQAIPARVLELLPEGMARVEIDGALAMVNIVLIDAAPGDTVFVHADVAIAKEVK